MLLGFVPARGGSKGIPRKNLVPLAGRPLIQYTLEAALASACIDELFLSTDDEEIAAFGARFGLASGYRRPAELSSDDAPLMDAVEHGLRWYIGERGRTPDEVLLLQPTSPLRTASDIEGAVRRFREQGTADTLVSVHRMIEHPYECVALRDGGWDYLVQPPEGVARRQDYRGGYFFVNGALYLARTKTLLGERRFIVPGRSLLYEMPRERGIDVDSQADLACAEALLGLARGAAHAG
jgi:CMP-N,N'-diacetyllegionaminic acid synthase